MGRERSAGGDGRRVGSGRGTAAWSAALAGAMLLAGGLPLEGQGRLAQYDYENLRLRGAGVDVFVVSPNDLEATVGIGARVDLGFLGPNVRVMPRFAWWSTELQRSEVRRLEDRLEDLVEAQNPDQPRPEIDLGSVDREAIIFGADVHWLPLVRGSVRPYLGLGAEVYFLNGSGAAIDDTFVEDALDLLTAGASAVAGLEIDVGSDFALYADARGSLVADVNNVALAVGLAYMVP